MPDSAMIRVVVFDLDGLMFNTEEVFFASGTELLARRDHVLTPELLRMMIGRRAPEAFGLMRDTLGLEESVESLLAESQQLFDDLLETHLAPMPGLLDLLDDLQAQGIPHGVATSSSRSFMTKLLTRFELEPRFRHTLTAEDVTHGKPHPEIYLTAAERFGVQPAEMLVLEDSENGTKAAAAAGAVVASVPHQHTRGQDFSHSTRVVDTLADPWIRQRLAAGR